MRLPSLLSALALLVAAGPACSPESKPPETPESPASTAAAYAPKDMAGPSSPDDSAAGHDKPDAPAERQGQTVKPVDKSLSLETYEMTPSDCNELGRHFGEVGRSDQLAPLNEKQRAATAAQIDKVIGKQEEAWTTMCQNNLVNKAVDHDAIKCALAAKTVKAFDVCLNGSSTIGAEPAKAPQGKRKK